MPQGVPLPVPDPTFLTTAQLQREIGLLRDIIETRFTGMDKAIALIQSEADKVPSKVDIAVKQLHDLHEEKFRSIQIQFTERDTRAEQASRDSKIAVDAALQAAKEAVGEQNKSNATANSKMEAAFTKQIDQIGQLISSTNKSTDDKIDDIKGRITTIEGRSAGGQSVWGYIAGLIGLLIGIISILVAVFMKHA